MPAGPRQPTVPAGVRVPPLTAASITERISDVVLERPAGRYWWLALGVSFASILSLMIAVSWLFNTGIGIWGDNIPVAWGWAIADYVWWSGLALGGTFVSGALYLLRADWRTPVNRMAQTMTVISVAMAGIFPVLHLGRPWFAYWIFVYPNKMSLWPQWRSSLTWDFYGLLTFVIFAVLFWLVGLLPDAATLRDRAKRKGVKVFYGLLALGWRGEARQWRYHQTAMRLLAGAAVVIVFWVHGMVALDFSIALLPGWHETMLPIYFASGAVFSGFALLLVLVIPVRRIYRLQGLITGRDLNNLAKCLLAVSLIMAYWYMMEAFMSFYSGKEHEIAVVKNYYFGAYAPVYWGTIMLNCAVPQLLWSRRVRNNNWVLFLVAMGVVFGVWTESYSIVVTPLYRGFMPSSWGFYSPTAWDWINLLSTLGVFMFLFLLFLRVLPIVSMFEMRGLAASRARGEV